MKTIVYNIAFIQRGSCDPYSEQTCRNLGVKSDFKFGYGTYKFADEYSTKGCYSYKTGKYKGHLFYGQRGTIQENSAPIDKDSKLFRPNGYDCNDEGNELKFKWCISSIKWFL